MNIPVISALDFVAMRDGEDAGKAIVRSVALAQALEKLGYLRFWLAEHHGAASVVASSPPVLIGHIAAATRSIRVGSGGVMLLNHSPMIVAEQFGTLEAMHPGRIDLGIGRAVGSSGPKEAATQRALRRDPRITSADFPELVAELQSFLSATDESQEVKAFPGQDSNVPLYLLSSSGYSARLAGELGLPLAFAAHFFPGNLMTSLDLYRQNFRPSKTLDRPYVMVTLLALAAETDEEARRSFTYAQQLFLGVVRGALPQAPKLVHSMDGIWTVEEEQMLAERMRLGIVGGRATVRRLLKDIVEQTGADELIFWSETYNDADRLRSYTILAETMASMKAE